MKDPDFDILIIGAGLSGLCLAYYLRLKKVKVKILEGRTRLGGRIQTTFENKTPIEMGATWISPQHIELLSLLQELGLDTFEQELGKNAIYEPISTSPHQLVALPAHQEPSYRIKGGSTSLILALRNKIGEADLELNCQVNSVEQKAQYLLVSTSKGDVTAKKVISTLPPLSLIHI